MGINEHLIDLLEYVEEMARMAERAVFSIHSYRTLAVLEHQLHNRVGIQHDTGDNDGPVWLRIERLQRFDPPTADDAIKDWLVVSRDPSSPPKVLTTRLVQMPRTDAAKLLAERRIEAPDMMPPSRGRGEDVVDVRLRLDRWPDRQRAIDEYVAGPWRRWADEERPRRETIAIYDRFFSVIQTIEATGAETPSEVVFGVGMVLWRTAARTIEHPLIESLVELDLDPTSHAIRVRPRGIDPELYLKPFEELDNQGVIPLRKAAGDRLAAMAADRATEGADFSPFDRRSFEPILRLAVTLLSSAGVYHPDTSPGTASRTLPEPDDTLTITDSWAIYVRPRSGNLYVQDIQRLKAEVEGTDEDALPPAAQRLVSRPPDEQVYAPSIDLRGEIGGAGGRRDREGETTSAVAPGTGPVLFPKPYNDAQVEIVRRLEDAAGVVVQGPPGTGKTHTIANIICHYLATGRSVLVTSKGEPALEVLRDQIPPEVRDLAISLLTSEREGLRQLERAVSFLANDVSNQQPHRIEASLVEREREVAGLQRELDGLDTEIRAFAEQQLGPVAEELAGAPGLLPAELARRVAEGRERYSWLTDRLGPVPAHAPRFSDEDIASARNARRKLGPDLCYLGRDLPAPNDLPDVEVVHDNLTRAAALSREAEAEKLPPMSMRPENAVARAESLAGELRRLRDVLRYLAKSEWLARHYAAWLTGDAAGAGGTLPARVLKELAELAGRRGTFLGRPVALPELGPDRAEVAQAIQRAARDERPFPFVALGRGRAKALFAQVRVDGRVPTSSADWRHAEAYLAYDDELGAFIGRWNALAKQLRLPELRTDTPSAGRWLAEAHEWLEHARSAASAFSGRVLDELRLLFPSGINADDVAWDVRALKRAIRSLEINIAAQQLSAAHTGLAAGLQRLDACGGPVVESIRAFLRDRVGNPETSAREIADRWQELLRELDRVRHLRTEMEVVARVADLVETSGAPAWARCLREELVAGPVDPWTREDWREAWRFRRLEAHLLASDGRGRLKSLAERRLQCERRLARGMAEVVRLRTHLGLHSRMTESRLSALMRFIAAVRRIGVGTGVRARRYRADARRAMIECMGSVPCWIMPTWRVSETLPPALGAFDLVIVDEASQSDATALPALLRGRKILVVGDDRQVSPAAVGLEERKLLQLRHGYLKDQPFADLLMPGSSLYDLAQAAFPGKRIMLNEHFRCVEPIIRFSFQFYPESIHPVRIPEASKRLDPPLVDVYVPHGVRDDRKVNEAEALAIVDEIETLVRDPVYAGRSIGVVSLIGDKQAHAIQNLLIERIGEDLYLRHRIACGDSATFQGKERDIVFLSMVASPGRAQAQTALLYEQRFNVALSRARDRMYLFRSVEPEHLRNPSDLKFRVIEHFRNPMPSPVAKVDSLIELCESEFEREVLRRLVELGYRVTPQVAVGEFRIDLVVEGDEDRRLAVELDGDRHHGPERWFEDWSRQKILERVGWRFWRCWASSFALDPDGCMADLLAILDEMRVRPVGAVEFRYTHTEHRIVAAETREPAPSLAVEAEEPEPIVEPGDRVILAFAHEPTRHYAFTISAHEHDPVNCIFAASDPIGRALLNATIEDELELPWQGESRAVTVLGIHKALDRRLEAQRQPSPPVAEAEVSVTETVAAAPAGAALEVEVGDTVTYRGQTGPDDETRSVRIVAGAGHPESGVVSEDSPVGSALLGLRVGDDAEVILPEGMRTLVVLEIDKGSGLQGGLSRDNVIPLSSPRQTRAPALPPATPNSARAPERLPTSAGRLQVDGPHALRVDQELSPVRTIPYVNWERRPLPDPRTAPLATVVQGLREIADAEGPMLAQRTYQLYARAAGLDRVGRIIRSRLDEVLQAALAQGLLVAEYEHDERETILAIIRPPQAPPVIVRTLGDRSFGEIPPSEIGEVMRWLIGKKREIDREQLHRGVLQHYALVRMTSQVAKELERSYMRFVHEEEL